MRRPRGVQPSTGCRPRDVIRRTRAGETDRAVVASGCTQLPLESLRRWRARGRTGYGAGGLRIRDRHQQRLRPSAASFAAVIDDSGRPWCRSPRSSAIPAVRSDNRGFQGRFLRAAALFSAFIGDSGGPRRCSRRSSMIPAGRGFVRGVHRRFWPDAVFAAENRRGRRSPQWNRGEARSLVKTRESAINLADNAAGDSMSLRRTEALRDAAVAATLKAIQQDRGRA